MLELLFVSLPLVMLAVSWGAWRWDLRGFSAPRAFWMLFVRKLLPWHAVEALTGCAMLAFAINQQWVQAAAMLVLGVALHIFNYDGRQNMSAIAGSVRALRKSSPDATVTIDKFES